MVPDFPHNIRIRMAQLIFFCCALTLLSLCPVGCLSSGKLNWDSQQGRKFFEFKTTQGVRPNKHTPTLINCLIFLQGLGPYSVLNRAYLCSISIRFKWGYTYSFSQVFQGLRLFKGVRLFLDSSVGYVSFEFDKNYFNSF